MQPVGVEAQYIDSIKGEMRLIRALTLYLAVHSTGVCCLGYQRIHYRSMQGIFAIMLDPPTRSTSMFQVYMTGVSADHWRENCSRLEEGVGINPPLANQVLRIFEIPASEIVLGT